MHAEFYMRGCIELSVQSRHSVNLVCENVMLRALPDTFHAQQFFPKFNLLVQALRGELKLCLETMCSVTGLAQGTISIAIAAVCGQRLARLIGARFLPRGFVLEYAHAGARAIGT